MTSQQRANILSDGWRAARSGGFPSSNPHPARSEEWFAWLDGFRHWHVVHPTTPTATAHDTAELLLGITLAEPAIGVA